MENNIILRDISYGNNERHRLDICIPEKPKSKNGVILCIHGGGWNQGDKTAHRDDMQYFCEHGYVCASMNYRFVAENINIFDELNDISAALLAIKVQCKEYGLDIKKVILSGGSAGGHLSLMFAYTRAEQSPVKPVAACVYCPPVKCWTPDFLLGISGEFESWKYQILSKCCGLHINSENFLCDEQQSALKKMSPMEYISEKCVPTAVFHGKHDDLVPFKHTLEFLKELTEANVKNDLLVFEKSGHVLDKDPEMWSKTRGIMEKYAEILF